MKKKFFILKTYFSLLLVLLGLILSTGTADAQYLDNLSDTWSKNPTAAYSTRKVISTYTGAAMRLRRSNDNAETDVFFDTNGWVSLASNVGTAGSGNILVDWVGVYSAYVTIWYDQSGNGNHATTAVNSGTISVTSGTKTVTGGITANVNITALNVELAAGDILYTTNGTVIGTVAASPALTANTLSLTSNATATYTNIQFTSSAQINTQPRFINGGVIETLTNGRPTLNILNGSTARTANGFTTPITVSSNENVNAFAVPYRTNNSQNDALIIGNVANYSSANSVNALAFGYNSSTTLGVRNGQVAALTTTLNKSEAVRYYANAMSATKKVGVVSLDASNVTTSANTNGAYTLTHTRSLNLFRAEGYATRSFTGKCPEIIFYKSTSISTDFNSTDAGSLLSTQKNKYLDAIVVTPITIQVGASKSNTTIQAAYNSIPTLITEPYIIELQSDYNPASEEFPITMAYVRGVSSVNTIIIRPAMGQSFTISGSSATQLFKLNGAKYVYIDGRAGGFGSTKALTIENTNTFAGASTIWMANSATSNKVQYCTVKGSSTSTTTSPTSGTIVIGSSTETVSGYGANTIDNCDIADATGGLSTVGVYLVGTTGFTNEGNIITNNNIYNYFNPGAFRSSGIYNDAYTNTTTITANKLYQTATRTYTAAGLHYPIYLNSAGVCTAITNNTIGYSENNNTGTYTIGGNFAHRFAGIYINNYLGGNAPPVTGNTISNIDVTSSSAGNGAEGVVVGIFQKTGNGIGGASNTPNTISNITLNYSSATTGTFGLAGVSYSYYSGSNNYFYCNIHDLKAIPTTNAIAGKVMGIYTENSAGGTLKANTIYNLSCGSIDGSNTAAHIVTGISSSTNNSALTVERNLIYNLNVYTTGASILTGLTCGAGTSVATIKNNIISLGNNVNTGYEIRGIYKSGTGKDLFYHNSVYIGGTTSGTTANTYAYYRNATTPSASGEVMANNIFTNVRNGGTTGIHYAFSMKNIADYSGGFISNTYNLYQFGTGANNKLGYIGADINDFSALQTSYSSFYTGSLSADPEFMNPTASTPDLRVMLNSSVVNAVGIAVAAVTDDYFGSTRSGLTPTDLGAYAYTPAVITTSASDYFRSKATGNWATASTWLSSTNNTDWANASASPTSSANSILIRTPHEVTVSANTTSSTLTVQGGGKLTLNDTYTLNASSLILQSDDTNGTASFTDLNTAGGLTVTGTTTVQQWLTGKTGTSTRAIWYLSSPVSGATASVFDVAAGTNKMTRYDEAVPGYVANFTSNAIALTPGVGYVAYNGGADAVYSFTGGSLNTGAITIPVTRTGTSAGKRGFNLVGNPYPSYLDWKHVSNTKTNLRSTIWYRTSVGTGATMTTDTYDGTTGTNNNNKGAVTQYIAPMQSFWVKVDKDGDVATLKFENAARKNSDLTLSTNKLKAPAQKTTVPQIVRLRVSNGTNSDETILVADANATDALDTYDSEKMSNDNVVIPEIYTLAGSQELVINHLSDFAANKQVALGFRPGTISNFSIVANEISNVDAQTKVILIDKQQNNAEFDLTDGTAYTFSADATPTANRFVIAFRAPGVATNLSNANNLNMFVYSNANNQITINSNSDVKAIITVCNAMGQKLVSIPTTESTTVIQKSLGAGVYFVSLTAEGNESTQKVIIK